MNKRKFTYNELEKLLDQAIYEIEQLKNEKGFKALAENDPDVIMRLDTHLRFKYINSAIETITGISPNDFIGNTSEELGMPEQLCKIWNNAFKMALDTGNIQETEFDYPGLVETKTYNLRILPEFSKDGNIESLLCISREITEEKKIKNELQFIASFPRENPYPVMRIDSNGILLFANEASSILLEAWDYSTDYRLPEDITEYAKQALTSGKVAIKELPAGKKYFQTVFAPIISSEYVNVYAMDTTNRKLAEEETARIKNELEERVISRTMQLRALAAELTNAEHKERKRLAGLLHDNLQQLLVSAKWTIQRVQKKEKSRTGQDSLTRSIDFLNEAIAASKSLVLELSPPVLNESGLIQALKWLSRWLMEKYDLTVNIVTETEIPPEQEAICILVFQSVRELLFNVIKHSQVKEAEILVEKNNNTVLITVTDHGTGFNPAVLEDNYNFNSGFGLLNIRERLEYMGGNLSIYSTKNMGTRVLMTVPLQKLTGKKELPDKAILPAKTDKLKTVTQEYNLNKIRVLVADDHKIMREGLCGLLNSMPDIEIVGEAPNGMNAVEMTEKLQPDIVIMDINMPILNGIEATRKIKSNMPDIIVIGLSMFEEEESAKAMIEAGASAYHYKTGPSNELIEAIRLHSTKFNKFQAV